MRNKASARRAPSLYHDALVLTSTTWSPSSRVYMSVRCLLDDLAVVSKESESRRFQELNVNNLIQEARSFFHSLYLISIKFIKEQVVVGGHCY